MEIVEFATTETEMKVVSHTVDLTKVTNTLFIEFKVEHLGKKYGGIIFVPAKDVEMIGQDLKPISLAEIIELK